MHNPTTPTRPAEMILVAIRPPRAYDAPTNLNVAPCPRWTHRIPAGCLDRPDNLPSCPWWPSPAVRLHHGVPAPDLVERPMSRNPNLDTGRLTGHALRNANLRAFPGPHRGPAAGPRPRHPPRRVLGLTRLEFCAAPASAGAPCATWSWASTPRRRHTLQQYVNFCRRCGGCGRAPGGTVPPLCRGPGIGSGSGSPAWSCGPVRRPSWPAAPASAPAPSGNTAAATSRCPCRSCAGCARPSARTPPRPRPCGTRRNAAAPPGARLPGGAGRVLGALPREGYAEKHLPGLGLGTAALRRLRYLELPAWPEVAAVARTLCRDDDEWRVPGTPLAGEERDRERASSPTPSAHACTKLRQAQGHGPPRAGRPVRHRRQEAGADHQVRRGRRLSTPRRPTPRVWSPCWPDEAEEQRARLLGLWEERRRQFHRRHRPETRLDLRLAREPYGFELQGHGGHPGVRAAGVPANRARRRARCRSAAQARILQAIERAGQQRVAALLASAAMPAREPAPAGNPRRRCGP